MSSSSNENDWNNYWSGRNAKAEQNALIGVGIENNEVLISFWNSSLKHFSQDQRIADFACGAGSVLKLAVEAGFSDLVGIDISEDAIALLTHQYPEIEGICAAVDETPLENNSLDLVVSQFGFEYAGTQSSRIAATQEILRVLKPDGQVVLISHIQGGAIERGCKNSLEQINALLDSEFFSRAMETFELAHDAKLSGKSSDLNATQESLKKLAYATNPVLVILDKDKSRKNPFSNFLLYLIQSSHKLITEFNKYSRKDGLAWFEQMQAEVLAYKGRMESMMRAALSAKNAEEICDLLRQAGFENTQLEKIHFPSEPQPIAWSISTINE